MGELIVWRHAKPSGGAGLCLGRTDVAVDRRRAKRLAHRIRGWARRHRMPHVVVTSSLERAAATGRWLASWGWHHRIDDRLIELDFGTWDGRPWAEIEVAEIEAWCADFAEHRPGGGESVKALLARCSGFVAEAPPVAVVGHAGWISAARWSQVEGSPPLSAALWPASVAYGALVEIGST